MAEAKQEKQETGIGKAAAAAEELRSGPQTSQTAVEHLKAAADILEAKDNRNRAVKTFHSVAADIRELIARLETRGGA
jgi:hypothetical protein